MAFDWEIQIAKAERKKAYRDHRIAVTNPAFLAKFSKEVQKKLLQQDENYIHKEIERIHMARKRKVNEV